MTLKLLRNRFSPVTVILFFTITLTGWHVQAQPGLLWAKQMESSSPFAKRGHAVIVDGNGNVFTTGLFKDIVDFDPGPAVYNLTCSGSSSIYVSKLDASGNFVWAKQFDGTTGLNAGMPFSIALDKNGNIFVTGRFTGTIDFDPGPGTVYLTSAGASGKEDIFVCKLDASGNLVWVKQMSGTDDEEGEDIAVDKQGNVIITGYFWNVVDFDPGTGVFNLTAAGPYANAYVCKLDNDGNFIWAKQLGNGGNSEATGYSIALDEDDNIYTVGEFRGTGDFDPGPGVSNQTSFSPAALDMYVSKLDASGNFGFAKHIGWVVTQQGNMGHHYIALDKHKNIFIVGAFYGPTDFDPGPGTFKMTSDTTSRPDVYVLRLDSLGNFKWADAIRGKDDKAAYAVAVDANSNVYVAGKFNGTVDFDPDASAVYSLTAGGGDGYILKLDSAGKFVCAGQIGGGNAQSVAIVYAITTDINSNLYVTGNHTGIVDFDPGTGVFNLGGVGYQMIFVAKYNSCLNLPVFPEANFRASDSVFCGNKCINFTDLSVNATSWEWHFQGASPSSSTDQYPQNICYTAAGAYDVTLIAKNTDGTDTLTKVQYINLNQAVTVSVSVTVTPPMPVCAGTLLNFIAIPVNGGTTPVYQWKVNGANVGTNSSTFSSATLNNNDVVTCELTSNLGCSGAPVTSTPITLQLSTAPDAGIISAVRDTICEGTPASLSVTGNTTTVQWQTSPTLSGFTDIASAVNTNYIAVLTQSAYFRVYASNGACADTSAPYEIVVKPSPVADFSYTVNGRQVTFSNQSTGATRYEWNFADGSALSTEENPLHNYSADGTYHVCLTAYNGSNCSFTECRDVVIGSVGIKSISSDASWKVFPNPFTDELLIEGIQLNDEIKSIQIYDLLGRELINKSLEEFQGNTLRIDVSGLAESMYILKIKTDNRDFIQPIVKQ